MAERGCMEDAAETEGDREKTNVEVSEIGLNRRLQRKDEYGCGVDGDRGETEDDRDMMNVDVAEMGVKQKTTEI